MSYYDIIQLPSSQRTSVTENLEDLWNEEKGILSIGKLRNLKSERGVSVIGLGVGTFVGRKSPRTLKYQTSVTMVGDLLFSVLLSNELVQWKF